MRKHIKSILSLILIATIVVPANAFAIGEGGEDEGGNNAHAEWCQSQDLTDPNTKTYTVHFNTDGGVAIPDTIAVVGCSLESMGKPPIIAEKENNTFFGWFTNDSFNSWDKYYSGSIPESDDITEITLYAKFVPNDRVINDVAVDVKNPISGTEVTVTIESDQGAVFEMQDPIPQVSANDDRFFISYAGWRTTDDDIFEGAFVAGQSYKASVSLEVEDGYMFSPTLTATINGEAAQMEEYSSQSNGEWTSFYTMLEAIEGETYTVTDETGSSITFVDETGCEYTVLDIQVVSLNMSDAELEEIDMDREMYNTGRSLILNAIGDNGDMLAYLEINVCEGAPREGETEPRCAHQGPFTVKLKIPEGMTGYNIYKLMYADVNVDSDGAQITSEDPIICDREGDYITCVLPHLSGYAMIGSNEAAPDTGVMINSHEGISESIILAIVLAVAFISAGVFMVVYDVRRR